MGTVKIEVEERLAKRILAAVENFESNESRLKAMDSKLDRLLGFGEQEAVDLSELSASVAAGRTIDESNKILIEGIIERLEHSQDPAVLALAAQLRSQREKLAAAVKENTPA